MSELEINNNNQSPMLINKTDLNTISYDHDKTSDYQISISQHVIGDFIIGPKLGEGTFSKVCQGTHKITHEKVAIKILSKDRIKEPHDKLRIEKEINVQKKLHHCSLIQQYCIIESKSAIYIVTEYCSGGELFDYIVSKRKLGENEACRIFQQLIAGLEYLHKQKIVHRDLKPENLLFSSKHELKIADFGLSNEYTGKLKTPCGSPCYAAPEMVTGKKYDGDAVDIWSAGVVLFTMVCGYLPFEDKNQTALFGKISKGIYAMPSFLSGPCKDMIRCLLVVDPIKRYSFERIKHHPWFQAINFVSDRNIFFLSPGLFVKNDIIPFDEEIVKTLVYVYKYNLKDVIIDITMNKHNSITTSYYLLVKKKVKNGEKSISDFSSYSEPFLEYIKKSISKLAYFANNYEFIIDYYYNRMKKIFSCLTAKSSIDCDEQLQQLESTLPTENGGISQAQSQAQIQIQQENNGQPLTNRCANKKYMFPMHFSKFINKQHSLDESSSSSNANSSNNKKSNLNVKNENAIHLKTEPNGNNHRDDKSKYNTIEYTSKSGQDPPPKLNTQLEKKIANRLALNASLNGKKSVLNEELLIKIRLNKDKVKDKDKDKDKETDRLSIDKKNSLKEKHNIKEGNFSIIKEEIISKHPQKTARHHFLNTSMISETRSNSPILSDNLFKRKIEILKEKKSAEHKNTNKVLHSNNKLTHYSQDQGNANNLEIACGRNKGNSFYETELKSLHSKIPHTNREGVSDSARVNKNSSIKKKHPVSLFYGWPIKKPQEKEENYCTNLNKFVNIVPSKTITNNNSSKKNTSHLRNKSLEAKTTSRLNNNSLPKTHHKLVLLSMENDRKKHLNTSFLNIYCKKTLTEIKESVISIVGKDVSLIKGKMPDIIQLECKFNTKYNTISFLLNINKIPDFKDYYLITPTLIKGNMWSVKCVFDKIKAQLIAF